LEVVSVLLARYVSKSQKGNILEIARKVGENPEKYYTLCTHPGKQFWYNK